MGNSGFSLKRLLSNKNTVTILAVILGVVFLYIAYNMRVKQAIEPKSVPIANQDIIANQVISSDMYEYVNVSSSFVKKSPNLVTNPKKRDLFKSFDVQLSIMGNEKYRNNLLEGVNDYKKNVMLYEELSGPTGYDKNKEDEKKTKKKLILTKAYFFIR